VILDSSSKIYWVFQFVTSARARARARIDGPIENFPETGRIKLIYHHVVPMASTSWHSDHWSSCFFSWAESHYWLVTSACARARIDRHIFPEQLGVETSLIFQPVLHMASTSWWY